MFERFTLTVMTGGKKPYDLTLSEFGSSTVKFGRNAAKSGYMIVISIDFDASGYTVKAEYEKGEITRNG